MSKKLSRRNFLKGAGKVTATMATIWAVGGSFEAPAPEPMVEEPEPEELDTWNQEGHPYYCVGGVTCCHTWTEDVW